MDYILEKTESFIKDINLLISDPYTFPDHQERGGKFKFIFENKEKNFGFKLWFEEKEKKHFIIQKSISADTEDRFSSEMSNFYRQCYYEMLRALLFSEDSFGTLISPVYYNKPLYIFSLKTLANYGLSKLPK